MKITLKFRFLLDRKTGFTSKNTLENGRKLFPEKIGFHKQELKIFFSLKIGPHFMGRTAFIYKIYWKMSENDSASQKIRFSFVGKTFFFQKKNGF